LFGFIEIIILAFPICCFFFFLFLVNVQQATLATGQWSTTYIRLQSLRLLLRLEGDESVALAHTCSIHDDFGALYRAIGAEDAG